MSRLLDRPKLIPTCLQKKIGGKEKQLTAVEHRMVKVETEKGKMGQRIFYWVKNVPLLLELLVVTACHDGKQEDSF